MGAQDLNAQPPPHANGANDRRLSRRQRKVHHKVKTGCKACKIRRQKCDEQKPTCLACSRYLTQCVYSIPDVPHSTKPPQSKTKVVVDSFCYPSPTRDLLASPSADLQLDDLELLHQFLMSTCVATAQLPDTTAHIQKTAPVLGQAHPFAMRGFLAMGATHLSRLRPSRQAHYSVLAAKHQNSALPAFRSAMQNLNEKNCHAAVSYSKSILWCSLAADDTADLTNNRRGTGDSWLPQWFRLLRGSCQLVEASRQWIKDGPLVIREPDRTLDDSMIADDQQISTLKSRLLQMTKSQSCASAISALREAFVRASMRHHNTPFRNAINFWAGSLSEKYIQSLQNKEPWALVVLAHFCVLFHRSETVWFMRGHATRLLLSITEHLNDDWKQHIEWPCQELGIGQCSWN